MLMLVNMRKNNNKRDDRLQPTFANVRKSVNVAGRKEKGAWVIK